MFRAISCAKEKETPPGCNLKRGCQPWCGFYVFEKPSKCNLFKHPLQIRSPPPIKKATKHQMPVLLVNFFPFFTIPNTPYTVGSSKSTRKRPLGVFFLLPKIKKNDFCPTKMASRQYQALGILSSRVYWGYRSGGIAYGPRFRGIDFAMGRSSGGKGEEDQADAYVTWLLLGFLLVFCWVFSYCLLVCCGWVGKVWKFKTGVGMNF